MAKKKKTKPFSKVQAVKEMARERVGALPKAQIIPNRKKKLDSLKRKPTLDQLLRSTEE